jgi:hypothetical protein
MSQSRWESFLEANANFISGVILGYSINIATMWFFAPRYGAIVAGHLIVLFCTIASLSRGYVVRRRFNRKSQTQSKKQSLIEACTNTFSGMPISYLIVMASTTYFPEYVGPVWTGVISCSLCLLWSLIRSYIVRRSFNQLVNRRVSS